MNWAAVASGLNGSRARRRDQAWEIQALLSGGLTMARTVKDPQLTEASARALKKRVDTYSDARMSNSKMAGLQATPGRPACRIRDTKSVISVLSPLSVGAIEERIAPLQDQLSRHGLYRSIRTLEHLRIFMESHVFAVWDFMSLLKSLQRGLTCAEVPWVPTIHPASRRFINQIVLGEESDEYEGRPMSHFEIYLEAMHRVGANTTAIERTLKAARTCREDDLTPLHRALENAPAPARRFVQTTFRTIRDGSLSAQAAAFTFGREDAIPHMFRSLVRDLNQKIGGDLSQFVWYLERHIEVDGDDHGPKSLRMVADVCGDDALRWEEAAEGADEALRARLALWDGILLAIR